MRAHEPNTQSFSALCALSIAYISSRFAHISSSMHIANQSIKNHDQGIAFLETKRIIALQVSESNRKEIMELRAFTAASRTDRTRTTRGTDDFKPIGKGLRSYENICQYAKTSAKLNSQSRALRIRQMVVQCNAMRLTLSQFQSPITSPCLMHTSPKPIPELEKVLLVPPPIAMPKALGRQIGLALHQSGSSGSATHVFCG